MIKSQLCQNVVENRIKKVTREFFWQMLKLLITKSLKSNEIMERV